MAPSTGLAGAAIERTLSAHWLGRPDGAECYTRRRRAQGISGSLRVRKSRTGSRFVWPDSAWTMQRANH